MFGEHRSQSFDHARLPAAAVAGRYRPEFDTPSQAARFCEYDSVPGAQFQIGSEVERVGSEGDFALWKGLPPSHFTNDERTLNVF